MCYGGTDASRSSRLTHTRTRPVNIIEHWAGYQALVLASLSIIPLGKCKKSHSLLDTYYSYS